MGIFPQALLDATLICRACTQQVLDLGAVDWTLTSPNFSNISVPGRVPSQVHLDLYAASVIEDPLYGLREFDYRWIPYSNWTYTSKESNATWIVFNGLDTFATIQFCGQFIGTSNNQFRQYYFDVTDVLSACDEPVLSINFGSAPIIANSTASLPGQNSWPYGVQQLYEFPNREFIRKEQNDFGWDWGPAFAPAGIWQPAYVIQLTPDEIYIRNTLVDIYREGQRNLLPPDQSKNWILNASIDYLGSLPSHAALQYTISRGTNSSSLSGKLENVTSTYGRLTGSVVIPSNAVDLWWPVGMGPQSLYNLTLEVVGEQGTIASVKKRIGFRTIFNNQLPVSQEQIDRGVAPGANWHFEINGHEFYAKGSNFIPPDPFWPSVTEERIRTLFESVVEGNQNMLRVWSSGAYAPDFIFELANEMGILLWSEFQFGCALYPVDIAFLENVAQEAEYQVRRVNHHPSLAYWAGGNELENLELALVNKTAPEEYPRLLAEYETLFLDTLATIVFQNTRSISYSPSSTTNGWQSLDFSKTQPITQRYNNLTKGSIYGNTDHYNYNPSQAFNISTFPVGRFANEFGYHSMPSVQSWQQAVDPEDLHFNSTVVMLRDHHPPAGGTNTSNTYNASIGQGQMTMSAQKWYPVPNKTDSLANFSAWCHTTQIFQADFYRAQIAFYRRGSALKERQLGSLYWQLEDQWQAPTWSGIEYDGRWKVLHYVAKDAYEPVVISAFHNATTQAFEIWVVSDLWTSITASVNLTWYDWSGSRLHNLNNITNHSSHEKLGNVTVNPINGHPASDALLVMEVTAEGTLPNSNLTKSFTHKSWFHSSPLSSAELVDPGLELTYSNDSGKFTVKATKGVAAWVWLDYPGSASSASASAVEGTVVSFEANAFWLVQGEEREVGYNVKKGGEVDSEWVRGVTVRSLWDNYVA
ncbi:glycoside hydrolase family 2 protein [Periconia macrospinosa]|uniref:Beta-mannosidase A n=1 Tax=Periconia macrospinosa TaxID=97972 RepID=A0A2V1EEH9_9PLEO|nr:glycoside hydrolase family 2 protein [Periconia macrospinosa]